VPRLFIRDVGNAPSSQIYDVIEDLGFGRVTRVNFRGNNAVVYLDWDIPNTRSTRMILEEGVRSLTIYYSETRFWKVSAYKEQESKEKPLAKPEPVATPVVEVVPAPPAPPAPPALSWVQKQIQESKARIEKERIEKEKNVDPKQKEYDNLRAGLMEIHAQALLGRMEDARLRKEKLEKERLEQERLQKEVMNELMIEYKIFQKQFELYLEPILESVDYGNVANFHPNTRSIIRARIGIA
jgi:hypothetical protein